VIRGGSWNNNGSNCRASNRNRNEPSNRNNNLGVRLAAAPPAAPAWCRTGPTALQFCPLGQTKRCRVRPVLVASANAPGGRLSEQEKRLAFTV